MFDILWDLYQQGQIDANSKTAQQATARSQSAIAETGAVENRLERLALINMAIWELVKEHTSLRDTDLVSKMRELDLRDGVENGKAGPAPLACPSCGRTISTRDTHCIYCSNENSGRTKLRFP